MTSQITPETMYEIAFPATSLTTTYSILSTLRGNPLGGGCFSSLKPNAGSFKQIRRRAALDE